MLGYLIDHTWQPVKDYIAKEITSNEKKVYFDSYEPAELEEIMDKQHKVVDYLKSQGSTKMFQILIVIDELQTIHHLHETVNYYINCTLEGDINILVLSHQRKFIK